jgi:hypothetical protein
VGNDVRVFIYASVGIAVSIFADTKISIVISVLTEIPIY